MGWSRIRRGLAQLRIWLRPQPKGYAFYAAPAYLWVKLVHVGWERPRDRCGQELVGPFRSELDCEEFCQAQNTAIELRAKSARARRASGSE